MLRRIVFSLLFLLAFKLSYACLCFPCYSFCHAKSMLNYNLVVSGKIVEIDTLHAKLKIFKVYDGIETKDTITIWAGTDWECDGIVSMSTLSMGSLFDTIITMLPRIYADGEANVWDIDGDYRRPEYFGYQTTLAIKKDTVRGNINGSTYQLPGWSVNKLSLAKFDSLWTNTGYLNCSSINEVGDAINNPPFWITINPNPFLNEANISIYNPNYKNSKIEIYNSIGQNVSTNILTFGENKIKFSTDQPGFYYYSLFFDEKLVETQKIIALE